MGVRRRQNKLAESWEYKVKKKKKKKMRPKVNQVR